MGNDHSSEAATPSGFASHESKAKAAFDEYKKRMEAAGCAAGGTSMHLGQPFIPPYPYGMPAWSYPPPPPPMMMPQPPGPPPSAPHHPGPSIGSGKSLFESIGNMIRLGIETANAGLAGGAEMMRGVSGTGFQGWDPHDHHPAPYPYSSGCGEHHGCGENHGCGSHGYRNCCEVCNSGCGCNPSVSNCH